MSKLKILICIFSLVNIVVGQYFKTNSHTFLQKINDSWVDFGRFAAVNLGVTKPGHLPGENILTSANYLRRFKRLEKLGVKVVRVYALLHPDFYKTLIEWNENHDNKIYVLHGTAHPEIEMEENNGTDAFNDTVSVPMIDFIERTVAGVYGQGNVVYKKEQGIYPITGNYHYNIAKYLLGWVVAGETSPYCVYATNKAHPNIEKYNGSYISSVSNSSAFEVWMARNMDYLASLMTQYGYNTPISWTNWATTDGIKNPVEPPYSQNDGINSSIEDWQEIDLHHFDFSNWSAGSFYNQHAYPYYPEFITLLNNPNGTYKDPYIEYIRRLRNYYNNLPFIITEVGISTTYGIASYEDIYGRNHGHVTEENQGILLKNIMLAVMNDTDINGIAIFQLQDEWFKKSWNTLIFEPNEEDGSGRNYWMNALSAEQGFGIFTSEPSQDMNTQIYNENDYLHNIKISNDERFIKLHFEIKSFDGKIIIGLNSIRGGTDEVFNLDIDKRFQQNIDYLFQIDVATKEVKFYVAGCHDYFRKKFGDWLKDLEHFPMNYSAQYLSKCHNDIFQSYLVLVKSPSFTVRDGEFIFMSHKQFEIEFKDNNDNLSLLSINNNTYTFKIPYGLIGYSNPALKQMYRTIGYSNKDKKDIKIEYYTDNTDIEFEISKFTDDGIELDDSIMILKYDWNAWEIPPCYQVLAKKGFNHFRRAFSLINGYVSGDLTDEEIKTLSYYSCSNNNFHTWHRNLSIISLIFLAICFLHASVIQHFFYCYCCKKRRKSSKLQKINFVFFLLLFAYVYYLHTIKYLIISFDPFHIDIPTLQIKLQKTYVFYLLMITGGDLLLFLKIIFFRHRWNLYKINAISNGLYMAQLQNDDNHNKHAFVIACHNSSNCIKSTLKSLLTKVKPESIYVADNGSSKIQIQKTRDICVEVTREYYKDEQAYIYDENKSIHYGYLSEGNKTVAQFGAISRLPNDVRYVTCIDDDTLLHETWEVNKVISYFENDETIGVLAYPLVAENPIFDIEQFQDLEYMISGFTKICESSIPSIIFNSTIFNSGAFGTYRVGVLRESFQNHNTDFNGDDLQICLNMHQLKSKGTYRVVAATNMIASTIVPKCWIHLRSVLGCLYKTCGCNHCCKPCGCQEPDLFGQRVKGWFVSKHRFIPKYLKCVFNWNGCQGIWVRLVIAVNLLVIFNEYFTIFWILYSWKHLSLWMLHGFMIGTAFNIFVTILFNYFVLKRNKLDLPCEVITLQPIIYKIFMITLYRYLGLLYNLLIYVPTHRSGMKISERRKDAKFRKHIEEMYKKTQVAVAIEFVDDNKEEEIVEENTQRSHSIKSQLSHISLGPINSSLQKYSKTRPLLPVSGLE